MNPTIPRCQVVPQSDQQVRFLIDGQERLGWHSGRHYPRPFFYPLRGPSGACLTRMGHPGAPNHDHHRSIWFAHHKVLGIDFWSDDTPARIQQQSWLAYEDGDDECRMAVKLAWLDGHDPQPLILQELVAVVRPEPGRETTVELQSTFRPRAAMLELGQTNFGFLAVRVAASISEYFGGGRLTNSEGAQSEARIFGRPARWMDYSGSVRREVNHAAASTPESRQPRDGEQAGADVPRGPAEVSEGITYFDHPSNQGYPAHWHVREDGWMGASLCYQGPILLTAQSPLVLRYLLHAHAGSVDRDRANRLAERFAALPGLEVQSSRQKHRQFEIHRKKAGKAISALPIP